jgi:hypothetical protein
MNKEAVMAETLSAFLISVAKSQTKLARFLEDPGKEARKAGLSEAQVTALLKKDAKSIFSQLEKIREEEPFPEPFVWVFLAEKAKPSGRPSLRTGKLRKPVRP